MLNIQTCHNIELLFLLSLLLLLLLSLSLLSLLHLTGNIRSLCHPISRLRHFTRFGGKTSYRLLNKGPASADYGPSQSGNRRFLNKIGLTYFCQNPRSAEDGLTIKLNDACFDQITKRQNKCLTFFSSIKIVSATPNSVVCQKRKIFPHPWLAVYSHRHHQQAVRC